MLALRALGPIFLVSVAACGGSAAPTAKSAKDSDKSQGAGSEGEGGTEDGESEEASAKASACSDGTCLECGSGLCPKGFYCDEKAPGGPACAWLPECAATATCSCVKQALGSGCSCSEKQNGPSVSCQ